MAEQARGTEPAINRQLERLRMKGVSITSYRGGIVIRTPRRTAVFGGGGPVGWDLLWEIQDIASRDIPRTEPAAPLFEDREP